MTPVLARVGLRGFEVRERRERRHSNRQLESALRRVELGEAGDLERPDCLDGGGSVA
jgi:hypothetical protein